MSETNGQNSPPTVKIELFDCDSELDDSSGSELEEVQVLSDDDQDVDVEDSLFDINSLPVLVRSPGGSVRPLLGFDEELIPYHDERSFTQDIEWSPASPVASTSRPDPTARERSPLRSPIPSPTRTDIVSDPITPRRVRRGRSVRQSPRAVSSRGIGRLRGRASRYAQAALGESEWRLGDRVMEVCRTDEDVPQNLKDMIDTIQSGRLASLGRASRQRRRNTGVNDDNSDNEYELQATQDILCQDLFGGDKEAMKFEWSPMTTFNGHAEKFLPKKTGPTVKVSGPYDAFRRYWTDDILQHIVRETNRYANEELNPKSERFKRDWYDTNVDEIMILFSFWMMLGIIRMPSIKSCYSNDLLLKTGIFRTLMTEARYWYLTRALHFVDNTTRTPDSSKLFSLGPIVEHLNAKFKEAYIMEQKIAIDESLLLWKGSLSFRQCIKTKAARFGIKTYELCESATGYLWSFEIYTGKDASAPPRQAAMPKSTEIVTRLMRPLLNKGYQLFLDNWFNSPVLARFLKRNKTDCIGTLRGTRTNVPPLIQIATLQEGTCIARHAGDVVVMAYMDKKVIRTISTCHGTESVQVNGKEGRSSRYKPALINDYNKSMGGVDKKDQMIEPFLLERKKNRKWYKKLFKRLLNVTVFNSRILWDKSCPDPVKTQLFRLELARSLIKYHLTNVPQLRTFRRENTRDFGLPPGRLVGKHYIIRSGAGEQLTSSGPSRTGPSRSTLGRKACVWCHVVRKRRKKTVYSCETCNVPLCLEECFKFFHEK